MRPVPECGDSNATSAIIGRDHLSRLGSENWRETLRKMAKVSAAGLEFVNFGHRPADSGKQIYYRAGKSR